MLPRELSQPDDLCSLRANEVRPVLACRMTLAADGAIEDNINSSQQLSNLKPNWLMTTSPTGWKISAHGSLLMTLSRSKSNCCEVCQRRSEWRQTHALVFKDRPDYRAVLVRR